MRVALMAGALAGCMIYMPCARAEGAFKACCVDADEIIREMVIVEDILEERISRALFARERALACSLMWTMDRFYNEIAALLERSGDLASSSSLQVKSAELGLIMEDYECRQAEGELNK